MSEKQSKAAREKRKVRKRDGSDDEHPDDTRQRSGSTAGSASESEGRDRSLSQASNSHTTPLEKATIILQSTIRGYLVRNEAKRLKQLAEKRMNVIKEIVATEKNYVNCLNVVINIFKKPLEEIADSPEHFVNKANIRSLFSDIDVILGVNEVLLKEITERVINLHPNSLFADAIIPIIGFFRWYQSYVGNYDKAFHTLQSLKKNPKFKAWLAQAEAKPECNYSDLESLLIRPVQRIPQYNILLGDLLKATHVNHPDYSNTKRAVKLMEEIGSYVNEKKRESENIAKVVHIGETLEGFPNLAVPYRRYLMDGDFVHVSDFSLSASARTIHLFVFNDIVLFTVEKEKRYVVEYYAYYDRISVNETPAKDIPTAWELKLKDQTFCLLAGDVVSKNTFCQTIIHTAAAIMKQEKENEKAKEIRRQLIKAANAKPTDSARRFGILAGGS